MVLASHWLEFPVNKEQRCHHPQSLMDFSPLSQLTNHIIAGLNELRQCAAIGVSASVHRQLIVVMECVIHEL